MSTCELLWSGRAQSLQVAVGHDVCARCRDPHLHFVEQVALAPPEVQIDVQQQQQYEAQLAEAANAPLPDEDEDIAE